MIMATGAPLRLMPLRRTCLSSGIGVIANPGFLVLSDVRRRHFERRLIPAQAAGKCALGYIAAARTLRAVAIAAGENAIDEIIAAPDQIGIGPRAAERDGKREDQCSCFSRQSGPHVPDHEYTCDRRGDNSLRREIGCTNCRSYCGAIPASLAASRMFS